jgi:hypothetical protein
MCDVIVGNDVEFGFMAGDYDKGLDKARELVAERRPDRRLQDGREGRDHDHGEGEITHRHLPHEALKPTGAGDSFMGGFVSGPGRGQSVRDAVLRGSAAAAMVVARVGCAPAMPTGRTRRLPPRHPGRPRPERTDPCISRPMTTRTAHRRCGRRPCAADLLQHREAEGASISTTGARLRDLRRARHRHGHGRGRGRNLRPDRQPRRRCLGRGAGGRLRAHRHRRGSPR